MFASFAVSTAQNLESTPGESLEINVNIGEAVGLLKKDFDLIMGTDYLKMFSNLIELERCKVGCVREECKMCVYFFRREFRNKAPKNIGAYCFCCFAERS